MPDEEIIHVLSAGASIDKTFPVATIEISGATKVYVIVENRVFEDSDCEKVQEERLKIRSSIANLKQIAEPFVKNGIHEKRISKDTLEDVRIAVMEIYAEHPSSKYFFNVSGGTKVLSIGLFMMGLWIEAVPYHVDRELQATKLSIPKIHISDLMENPNRVIIMEILGSRKSKRMPRKELFRELANEYIPIRERNRKKRDLKDGVFNSLVQSLLEWGFIEEGYIEGNRKEKEYSITPDGEFTLNFVEIKKKSK